MAINMVASRLITASWAVQWLAGPILEKELRVGSRRRRSYALRFAYVSLLAVVVAVVWFLLVHEGKRGLGVFRASRMGVVGTLLTVALVWFQFIAAQLMAMVLVGDTITIEIRRNTLHVLAVTPISGMEIVRGKLAGGLLHVIMLLAISLPLLAIVRVFGAVPSDYVASGVCITLTATVFLGALHLFASTCHPRTWGAAISMVWYFLFLTPTIWPFIDWLADLSPTAGALGKRMLLLVSPTEILFVRTQEMLTARPGTALSSWWPLHCVILLGGTAVALLLAARRMRDVAIASGWESPYGVLSESKAHTGNSVVPLRVRRRACFGTSISRVEGPAIVWRQLRSLAVFGSRRPVVVYGAPALGACLFGAAVFGVVSIVMIVQGGYSVSGAVLSLGSLVWGLHFGFVVGLAGTAAGGISKEREARTLPILLTTPLQDGEIVRDHAIAAFRRSLPVLSGLATLCFLFLVLLAVVTDKIGAVGVACGAALYLMGLAAGVPFLIGLGLYCGARLNTTAAFASCTSISGLGLMALGFVATAVWVDRPFAWSAAFVWAGIATVVCAVGGLILMHRASRRLRRNVF